MRKIFLYTLATLLSIDFCYAQTIDRLTQEVQVDIIYLASDVLQGREPGTMGETLAAEYIASRFEEIGLTPVYEGDSWYQSFVFTFSTNPHAAPGSGEERTAKNVLGYLHNGSDHTVIIGAHYDHLGYGEFGSRHVGEKAIHNGADDNASGIAAMLYLAEQLTESEAKNNNYLFIAFSAEEMGLYGSKYFVNNPWLQLKQVNYMLNMDMVGRLNEDKVLVINGAGTSPAWEKAIQSIEVADISPKTTQSGVGPSDHTSFYLKDIPVLHFFTGQHTDYHKPEDDSHLVNFQGVREVGDFILTLIEKVDGLTPLEFSKTKNESENRQVSRFKVSLGVMPDYVHEGDGMRIDAVLDDRPAAQGGLEDGDIVIKIGEYEVTDIYTYMDALSQYESGDTVTIVVMRGEEKLEKEVTF